jgi:hypothetical protein
LAAGCRDAVLEPSRTTSASAVPTSFSRTDGDHDRTVIGTLDLSPAGGTYQVGDFSIVMPAGAVCDPRTTKYGSRHWDEDCTPANRSITVNVIAKTKRGQVSVDFQPDVRFRPSAGWVRIETSAYHDLLTTDAIRQLSAESPYFGQFSIFYVPSGNTARIDEARSSGDASMVTHVERSTGVVWRRVKHFSGYMVSLGDKCAGATDLACPATDDPTGVVGSASLATDAFMIASVLVTP